ncbi:hypothetical protein B0H16DRAFT_1454336 [Mycena metata]|uniref:F-box domain-containing protein n=1 Tax=Mycena metata TaxID=1033252 RepID=A0AAD7JIW8_9AGAR|nr:hypothetical protein B0H16DRAFT_1454336 [Mycena metata]
MQGLKWFKARNKGQAGKAGGRSFFMLWTRASPASAKTHTRAASLFTVNELQQHRGLDSPFEHTQYNLDSAISSLRCNYSPEYLEANLLVETVVAIDAHLLRYEPEISRVQSILASLQEQQTNLKRYQECCRSVLSPVRKLPTEVLQLMFMACAGAEPDTIPVVGQVCSYWRDVVIGTPSLWSYISVGRTRYTSAQRYLHLASLFLERSASHPLTVSLRDPLNLQLLDLVRRQANRWGTLRISASIKDFYDSLRLESHAMPMLKNLEMVEEIMEAAVGSPPISIQQAPNLTHVSINGPSQFWFLPWAQLTRLQYTIPTAEDAITILRQCPQLVECSLGKLRLAPQTQLLPVGRSHNLRFLRLAVDTVSHVSSAESIMQTFFTSLTLPSLTSLEIIGQWSVDGFLEFLARSECKLENLTLGTGYMHGDKVLTLLESLPLLKTLVLDADVGTSRHLANRVITDNLLRRLIFYPDSDCVLPRLTHLTLRTPINFEDQVLLDVIESRWIPWVTELCGVPVARLVSVDLVLAGRREVLESSSIEELRELLAAGLHVSLQQGLEKISLAPSTP